MRRAPRLAVGWLLAASLACGPLPVARYYQLRAGDGEAAAAAARLGAQPTLGVDEFEVDPPYDQERIVYRVGGEASEVGFYAYHRWAVPPSRMLPGVVAGALAGTAGLGRIEPARPGVVYSARLGGRLLALEEIDVDGLPSVRVSLVLRLRTVEGAEIWSRPVTASSSLDTEDVAELVAELNRLLVEELRRVGPELAGAIASSR